MILVWSARESFLQDREFRRLQFSTAAWRWPHERSAGSIHIALHPELLVAIGIFGNMFNSSWGLSEQASSKRSCLRPKTRHVTTTGLARLLWRPREQEIAEQRDSLAGRPPRKPNQRTFPA